MSLHENIATFEADPPEWQGPPLRVLPGVGATERLLVDTGAITIALGPLLAYPTGVTIRLEISDPQAPAGAAVAREWLGVVDGALRVDVRYADRRPVTVVAPAERRPEPKLPGLVMQQAEGLACEQTVEYWLSPLPPAGPMTISVAWPRRGIAPTACPIDGAQLRRASERSRPF